MTGLNFIFELWSVVYCPLPLNEPVEDGMVEACTSYFSHCSDQILDKKQLNGERDYFGPWFEGRVRHGGEGMVWLLATAAGM